jgi:hypothetical protein
MSQNNEQLTDSTELNNSYNNNADENHHEPDTTSIRPRISPAAAFNGMTATLQATREDFCKTTNNISVKLQKVVRDFRACIEDGYRTLEALEDKAGRKGASSEVVIREQEDVSAQLVNARLITNQAISKIGMADLAFKKAVVEETVLLERRSWRV